MRLHEDIYVFVEQPQMKRVVAAWFAEGQMRNKDFQDMRWHQTIL